MILLLLQHPHIILMLHHQCTTGTVSRLECLFASQVHSAEPGRNERNTTPRTPSSRVVRRNEAEIQNIGKSKMRQRAALLSAVRFVPPPSPMWARASRPAPGREVPPAAASWRCLSGNKRHQLKRNNPPCAHPSREGTAQPSRPYYCLRSRRDFLFC